MASFTKEVLVLNSAPTQITRDANTRAVEIQNRGPNSIFVALNDQSACAVNTSREVQSGEAWTVTLDPRVPIFAIAATADQVSGAATIVTELN